MSPRSALIFILLSFFSDLGEAIMLSYENLFLKIAGGLSSVQHFSSSVVDQTTNLCSEMASTALVSARDFIELVGSSFILLLSVFPNTLSLIYDFTTFVASEVLNGFGSCRQKVINMHQLALEAPIEFSIGLFTCKSFFQKRRVVFP